MINLLTTFCLLFKKRKFKKYLKSFPCDAIFATHPYGSTVFAALCKKLKLDIPVYYYATDVFFSPDAAISNDLRRFFISTEEGKDWVISLGEDPDKIALSPFPLQQNVKESPKMSKEEAREKLGLENIFTLQLNMGGEGLGSLALLNALSKKPYDIQILVIGNIDAEMQHHIKKVQETANKNVKIIPTGYITNVNEYLLASDIVAGRLGINTILEAFYMERPFLITELVYSVKPAAGYVEKYQVGWNCNQDVDAQVKVIDRYANDLEALYETSKNFAKIPIEYDAAKFAKQIENDIIEKKGN